MVGDIFAYHLNWSTPFTWPGFPITSYNVSIYNYSSGETTTTMKYRNDTGVLSLTHQGTSDGESCYRLNFTVAANNRLGEGERTVIQSGHSIGKARHVNILTMCKVVMTPSRCPIDTIVALRFRCQL